MRASRTLWTFAISSIALFMVTLDNLVVTTAIPVIREDLDASLSSLEWTVRAYTLTFAVLLLTGAALGDRFGRRRVFAVRIGIFERWVGTVRRECLDRLLIIGRRHLERVLDVYTIHYNEHRPHRALGQRSPLSKLPPSNRNITADVIDLDLLRRRDILGGLIHEYQLAA
jgi:hypothetical protein